MQQYLKKVFYILPTFLLAVFLCVGFLGISRYFLEYKFHIVNYKDVVWDLYLPMILSVISLILMRKRISVLKHSNPDKDNFIYFVICAIVLCAALVSSQFYYKIKFSQNQAISEVNQITFDKNVNRIKINSYFVDDGYLSSKFTSDVSGKYGNDLNLHFYFVTAILKDSLEEPKDDLPQVWFANHFSKIISNRLSDEEKRIEFKKFREKCYTDLENFNFYNNAYFVKVPNSDEKDIFERLILNVVDNPQNREIIFLSPSNGKFNDDGGSALSWLFYILGIGIVVILFAVIFPIYQEKSVDDKNEEDDFNLFLQLFIPKKEFFITPILIDLNVLVFIILSLFGVNPFYPGTEDLVTFGALFKPISNGEYWRFISSMFLHGGFMHLLMNLIVLGIAGFISENILSTVRFAIIYFFSGIIAGFSSLLWHDGDVILVGASGAIFGLIGSIAMALILQNNFKENKVALLVIFTYFVINIFFGFISNSDNAAHISGFICGMLIGLLGYVFDS
jgi:rhomboid protease GluP